MVRFPLFLVLLLITASNTTAAVASPVSTQNPKDVTQIARQFLTKQAEVYSGTAQIVIDAPDTDQLPACSRLQAFLRGQHYLRSRLSVGIRCLAPQSWTIYVRASLTIKGTYYVAAHTISADSIIARTDLAEKTGDLLRLPRGVVLDPHRLIGYVASQRIRVGQPIKSRTVRSPLSIQRGQTVRTVARGTGFVASSSGQALEDGPPGSRIQVRTQSGRIISATVVNAHTVQVLM